MVKPGGTGSPSTDVISARFAPFPPSRSFICIGGLRCLWSKAKTNGIQCSQSESRDRGEPIDAAREAAYGSLPPALREYRFVLLLPVLSALTVAVRLPARVRRWLRCLGRIVRVWLLDLCLILCIRGRLGGTADSRVSGAVGTLSAVRMRGLRDSLPVVGAGD